MISISRLSVIATAAVFLTVAAGARTARASEVCMNQGNGNGGSIAVKPYLFNNNTFNWRLEKSDSYECLTLNYTSNPDDGIYYDGFSSTWDWPANGTPDDVKAYPSVVYGWQYGYTFNGLGLPAVIYDNPNVPVTMKFGITGSQSEDLLIDNWILSSAKASRQFAEMEVFVTDTFPKQTGGNLGTITLDDTFYYVSDRYCDCGGSYGWEAYNFIPNENSTSFSKSFNIDDYVDALVYDFGVFSKYNYLGGTQVGMEIYQGKGGIDFTSVSISAN